MRTVQQLLKSKGSDLWTISPDASVFEALKSMAEHGIGALIVMRDDRVVGILSERDYARKVILMDRASKETPVQSIMTAEVFFVRPQSTIEECMQLMSGKHIRHLPVLEDGRPVGIISIGDVVTSLISEKDVLIEQLENYITGR